MRAQRCESNPAVVACEMPVADYVDAFAIDRTDDLPAVVWCIEFLEGGRPFGRGLMQLAWRGPLGLRLGSLADPALVAGWQVSLAEEHLFAVRASSWMLAASLIFEAQHGRAVVTTAVTYNRVIARLVWGEGLSAVHRAVMPRALGGTRARMNDRERAPRRT